MISKRFALEKKEIKALYSVILGVLSFSIVSCVSLAKKLKTFIPKIGDE